MNATAMDFRPRVWRQTPVAWAWMLLAAALCLFVFREGLGFMLTTWNGREEYSHGFLIPFISLFFIWQKKDQLERISFAGSWAGFAVVLLGVAIMIAGELATLFTVVEYALLVVIAGLVWAFVGWRGLKLVWAPLFILAFMIPLPEFLLRNLSLELQLLSSQMGVSVIRAFGVSVSLEGNVIDLGSYKLQVVDACSGLRYLFPLMTVGFISAYLFRAPVWQRVIVFLSTIPITVLMNSFRIGVIGVTVDRWGEAMAEGFLHDFEGWVVFMACAAIVLGEMWLLNAMSGQRLAFSKVFGLEWPNPSPRDAEISYRKVPLSFGCAALLLAGTGVFAYAKPDRLDIAPARESYAQFPLQLGQWTGHEQSLQKIFVDALKFDDYLLVDYVSRDGKTVNLYSPYYRSQRKGESTHSPRSCIPGDGWAIKQFSQLSVPGVAVSGRALEVNRVLIEKGEHRQVVYYWFQQRGRVITNEFMVKWYLFWDAITRSRTDGAMVRLTAVLPAGADPADADASLVQFATELAPQLDRYIPS